MFNYFLVNSPTRPVRSIFIDDSVVIGHDTASQSVLYRTVTAVGKQCHCQSPLRNKDQGLARKVHFTKIINALLLL